MLREAEQVPVSRCRGGEQDPVAATPQAGTGSRQVHDA